VPYYVCAADAAGNRIVGAEEQLLIGPADVEYPTDPAGTIVDTPDGNVVKQQPSQDPRKRAWVWHGLPRYITRFDRFVARLEGLVSRTRREQGLSPYIYLKEDATNVFRRWEYQSGAVTSVGATTLTDNTKNWVPNRYANATVEISSGLGAGQRRTVVSNTATQLVLSAPWTVNPSAAHYTLLASITDWLRVRVLEVSKRVAPRGGVSYDQVRLMFVLADPSANDLG
jgi:hypothetical protein